VARAFEAEIERLIQQTKEVTYRAQCLSETLGALYGLTNTWAGHKIGSKQKLFFDIAVASFLDRIIIYAGGLLQIESNRYDDAILQKYYDFVNDPHRLRALVCYHSKRVLDFDSHHEKQLRKNATALVKTIDGIDPAQFKNFYSFRSKRIAHSTSTEFLSKPLIKHAIDFARKAIGCSDLAYVIFAQTGFDHNGSEKMAYQSAETAVSPHLDPPERKKRSSG
jgi:hypothetical protein